MPKSEVFFVTPELQHVLDNQPAKPPRSILDPFRAFILRWRREGRTYRDIQQILAVECKVRVHHETLRRFIKRRSRPRKAQPDLEFSPVNPVETTDTVTPRLTAEERAAARAALRASYNQPLFPNEEKKPLFVRRPGPIRNLNNEGER
jgi:hypothetical protein